MREKIVLAYSGGLDTSIIIPWLKENYSCDVIAMVGDDLGDFVDTRVFAGDRASFDWRFGVNWFVLPNPIYGSWTNAYPTTAQRYAGLRPDPETPCPKTSSTRNRRAGRPSSPSR